MLAKHPFLKAPARDRHWWKERRKRLSDLLVTCQQQPPSHQRGEICRRRETFLPRAKLSSDGRRSVCRRLRSGRTPRFLRT